MDCAGLMQVEPGEPSLEPAPGSSGEDYNSDFDLDLLEDEARSPAATSATTAGPVTIEDLPALRTAMESSDGSAVAVARCLKNMVQVAEGLSPNELAELHKDPLMAQIVDVIDRNMHRFTAQPLSTTLWSFAKLRYVPGQCAPCHQWPPTLVHHTSARALTRTETHNMAHCDHLPPSRPSRVSACIVCS